MSKVLLTGSSGTIGSVLKAGLRHEITSYDLPESDVENLDQLTAAANGYEAIIHLAWDTARDNWQSGVFKPGNLWGNLNVYLAAVAANVGRVIIASSVHADKYYDRELSDLLDPYEPLPHPDSPYGASKIAAEIIGRQYARMHNLGVVCIRFGGVYPSDEPPSAPDFERHAWLSHRDCVSLVSRCLEADEIPDSFAIVYGVSNNSRRRQDLSNPFGWEPADGID